MSDIPNNTLIENIAINHLSNTLAKARKLNPDIKKNDKTLSWDGDIEVYNNESFKKNMLCGIVPIQVKGKWSNNLSAKTIKFQIEIADLKNYQKNGGVIFFVIYCTEDNYQIYYEMLMPLDLDRQLENIKTKQLKKGIVLRQFPQDSSLEMYGIFKDYLYHSKLQAQRDEKIQKQFETNDIKFSDYSFTCGFGGIPCTNEQEFNKYILNHPTYMYVKPKQFDINVVIDKIELTSISQEINSPVIIDGKMLYDSVIKTVDKNGNESLEIGNYITCYSNNTIKFKLAPDLTSRIKQLKFLIYIMKEESQLSKKNYYITLDNGSKITLIEYQKMLDYLIDVKRFLDLYGMTKDLILEDIDDKNYNLLKALVECSLYNKPIPYSLGGKKGYGIISILNLNFLVICLKTNKDGLFTFKNFFDYTVKDYICKIPIDSKEINVSPYLMLLNCNDLQTIDNLNFELIIDSIKSFGYSKELDNLTNLFVLKLISSYDQSSKDNTFLSAASELIVFLKKGNHENKIPVYTINEFQIKKRRESLSVDDKSILCQLKFCNQDNYTLLTCANILLENFDEASFTYEKMSVAEKEGFNKYPINTLWIKKQ